MLFYLKFMGKSFVGFYVFFIISALNAETSDKQGNIIFSHGLGGCGHNIYYYTKQNKDGKENPAYHFISHHNICTFDYEDADQNKINLAQEPDRVLLKQAHEEARLKNPEAKTLLFGVSRGGSCVLYYMGSEKPEDVNAIIVESPFAKVEDVIAHYHLKKIPGKRLRKWLARFFAFYLVPKLVYPSYKPNGPKPVEYVEHIPQTTSLLLVCSKEDHLVPATSTIKLYKKLKQAGHQNVYLLVLDHGEHAKLLRGRQGSIYQKTVHAFLKKNGYPHDPDLAHEGDRYLQAAQPSLQELTHLKEKLRV
jgi:hypothetical protein